jgi:hypothetical protein
MGRVLGVTPHLGDPLQLDDFGRPEAMHLGVATPERPTCRAETGEGLAAGHLPRFRNLRLARGRYETMIVPCIDGWIVQW